MEKGRAASRIADDEDGRPDLLVPVSPKEDVVQEKTEPDRELEKWIPKVEGNKNSDTPRCPPPAGQPKVRKPEEPSEIEWHLVWSHGGKAAGEKLKKGIRY
jgi:hypothetical protein